LVKTLVRACGKYTALEGSRPSLRIFAAADDLAFHQIDDLLGDIDGPVADPLKMTGDQVDIDQAGGVVAMAADLR
jgi:hypothetical protein